MKKISIKPIGEVVCEEDKFKIVVNAAYKTGLKGLKDYSHVQVLWWMHGCDNEEDRTTLLAKKPYVKGPEVMGIFATRSPERPNPIGVSNVDITYIDEESGLIGLYYIDAFPGTKVLDLKPYTPSIDRVEYSRSPEWCSHWPQSYEESGNFDWNSEFNF